MPRTHLVLGIAFLVIGVANALQLNDRPWGIGTGVVFGVLGFVFIRKARRERA